MSLFKRRNKDLFTIPEPGPATSDNSGFRMTVEDVFVIAKRGTVVTGTVEAGAVTVGTRVTVERTGRAPLVTEITGIETARKRAERAGAGDHIGLLFRSVTRGEITTGDVIRTR